ncbi:hypothetical protein ACLESD_09255 [Pyxidicoccus sp. 3LFB2]
MNPTQQNIEAAVIIHPSSVVANLTDHRPDTLHVFGELSEAQRQQLASDAWHVGLRALMNAHAQAQEARLQDVGTTLVNDLQREMESRLANHHQLLERVLREYFDPNDGKLAERLDRFVHDDGELPRVLGRYLHPSQGVIAEALAAQVGENSPLFKKLSPTESEGLLQMLKAQLTQALSQGQGELVKALDPLHKEGAVGRFLTSLREELQKTESDRRAQLDAALKALDANDPNSLLNNLAKETQRTGTELLNAMNPAHPGSPLALLRNSLTEMLQAHIRSSRELHEVQDARQRKFETEVREAITRLETRRSGAQKTAQGGLDYQDAVIQFIGRQLTGGPYTTQVTANHTGLRTNCKVGDLVVHFSQESAFAGTAVVFECKREAGFSVMKALDELDTARENRAAAVGVFVMASSHASADFPSFARYGNNLLVTFDPEAEESWPRLQAAVMVALALASRRLKEKDAGNADALKDVEKRLQTELERVEKMRVHSNAIRKNNDGLGKQLDLAEKELKDLLEKAGETLKALHIAHAGEKEESATPIAFPKVPAASAA